MRYVVNIQGILRVKQFFFYGLLCAHKMDVKIDTFSRSYHSIEKFILVCI